MSRQLCGLVFIELTYIALDDQNVWYLSICLSRSTTTTPGPVSHRRPSYPRAHKLQKPRRPLSGESIACGERHRFPTASAQYWTSSAEPSRLSGYGRPHFGSSGTKLAQRRQSRGLSAGPRDFLAVKRDQHGPDDSHFSPGIFQLFLPSAA